MCVSVIYARVCVCVKAQGSPNGAATSLIVKSKARYC